MEQIKMDIIFAFDKEISSVIKVARESDIDIDISTESLVDYILVIMNEINSIYEYSESTAVNDKTKIIIYNSSVKYSIQQFQEGSILDRVWISELDKIDAYHRHSVNFMILRYYRNLSSYKWESDTKLYDLHKLIYNYNEKKNEWLY